MGKDHPNVEDYVVSRARALESLLMDKGVLQPDSVDRVIRRYAEGTGRRPRCRLPDPPVPPGTGEVS